MSKKKKNKGSKKGNAKGGSKGAKALQFLKDLETKGNAKNTLLETGKSLVVGIAGAGLGAAIGKPSLGVGLVVTGVGHYKNSKYLTNLGLGMMASGGYQIGEGLKGPAVNGLDGAKDRLKNFGENIKQRLYLDKIIKKKSETTNGLGKIQYFKYPKEELDMGSLSSIEDEISRSSEQFEQRQMAGSEDDLDGVDEEQERIM